MAPAAAFAEVLDRCLDHAPIRDAAAAGRFPFGVATRSLFWFEGGAAAQASSSPSLTPPVQSGSGRTGNRPFDVETAAAAGAATARAIPPLRLVPSARCTARPTRVLSTAQRAALDQLIGLGATLEADFTIQELRSQFRALARAYHPDRQVGPAASAAPAHAFVTLRSAYDVLKHAA